MSHDPSLLPITGSEKGFTPSLIKLVTYNDNLSDLQYLTGDWKNLWRYWTFSEWLFAKFYFIRFISLYVPTCIIIIFKGSERIGRFKETIINFTYWSKYFLFHVWVLLLSLFNLYAGDAYVLRNRSGQYLSFVILFLLCFIEQLYLPRQTKTKTNYFISPFTTTPYGNREEYRPIHIPSMYQLLPANQNQ